MSPASYFLQIWRYTFYRLNILVLPAAEIPENTAVGTYLIALSWESRDIYDENCDMIAPKVTNDAIKISD